MPPDTRTGDHLQRSVSQTPSHLECRDAGVNFISQPFPFTQNSPDGKGMNIDKVWQQGVTGKGIVVAVVDDGLQQSHPDLQDNYVSKV